MRKLTLVSTIARGVYQRKARCEARLLENGRARRQLERKLLEAHHDRPFMRLVWASVIDACEPLIQEIQPIVAAYVGRDVILSVNWRALAERWPLRAEMTAKVVMELRR